MCPETAGAVLERATTIRARTGEPRVGECPPRPPRATYPASGRSSSGTRSSRTSRSRRPLGARRLEQHYRRVCEFAERYVAPRALEIDRRMSEDPTYVPWDILEKACEYRLYSATVSRRPSGGSGTHALAAGLTGEILSTHCVGIANLLGVSGLADRRRHGDVRSARAVADRRPRVPERATRDPDVPVDLQHRAGSRLGRRGRRRVRAGEARRRSRRTGRGWISSERHEGVHFERIDRRVARRRRLRGRPTPPRGCADPDGPTRGSGPSRDAQRSEDGAEGLQRRRGRARRRVRSRRDGVSTPAQATEFAHAGMAYILGVTRTGVGGFAAGVAEAAYRAAFQLRANPRLPGRPARAAAVGARRARRAGHARAGRTLDLRRLAAERLQRRRVPLPRRRSTGSAPLGSARAGRARGRPADRVMGTTAAERLFKWWAGRYSAGERDLAAAMGDVAKVSCSDLAMENCQQAISLMGKDGLRHEHGAEKLLRDVEAAADLRGHESDRHPGFREPPPRPAASRRADRAATEGAVMDLEERASSAHEPLDVVRSKRAQLEAMEKRAGTSTARLGSPVRGARGARRPSRPVRDGRANRPRSGRGSGPLPGRALPEPRPARRAAEPGRAPPGRRGRRPAHGLGRAAALRQRRSNGPIGRGSRAAGQGYRVDGTLGLDPGAADRVVGALAARDGGHAEFALARVELSAPRSAGVARGAAAHPGLAGMSGRRSLVHRTPRSRGAAILTRRGRTRGASVESLWSQAEVLMLAIRAGILGAELLGRARLCGGAMAGQEAHRRSTPSCERMLADLYGVEVVPLDESWREMSASLVAGEPLTAGQMSTSLHFGSASCPPCLGRHSAARRLWVHGGARSGATVSRREAVRDAARTSAREELLESGEREEDSEGGSWRGTDWIIYGANGFTGRVSLDHARVAGPSTGRGGARRGRDPPIGGAPRAPLSRLRPRGSGARRRARSTGSGRCCSPRGRFGDERAGPRCVPRGPARTTSTSPERPP